MFGIQNNGKWWLLDSSLNSVSSYSLWGEARNAKRYTRLSDAKTQATRINKMFKIDSAKAEPLPEIESDGDFQGLIEE